MDHKRRSIRLQDFDYSQAAHYFVTLVAQDRAVLFGTVNAQGVCLGPGGKLVEAVWLSLEARFPRVVLGDYVIMPNHLHAVISFLPEGVDPVGAAFMAAQNRADTRSAPTTDGRAGNGTDQNRADTRSAPTMEEGKAGTRVEPEGENPVGAAFMAAQERADTRSAPTKEEDGTTSDIPKVYTLGNVIGAFKSLSTLAYIRAVESGSVPRFSGKLWQRNYFEHIIRDQQEWEQIGGYIAANPLGWAIDAENPERGG